MDTSFFSNIIYEIYVRSFQDSNGDGIGDLPGIISRLDYLKTLGVNTIWLTPVFETPNYDFGYDVSDYYRINPEYGTEADLLALLDTAHQKKIRVLLDLVLNHCSSAHHWFIDAVRNPDSAYRDFFIFRDHIPNNLGSQFGTSAWHLAENGRYYLGLFSKYQPDFNWRNPAVRKELLDVVEHYLKLGVDGFRFDVLSLIQKPEEFAHIPTGKAYADFKSYTNYPGIEAYLAELSALLNRYGAVSIGEGSGLTIEEGIAYSKYLTSMLTFDLLNLDGSEEDKWNEDTFDLRRLRETLEKMQRLFRDTPQVLFIENHDQPRIPSRIASPPYSGAAAKALATILYCLRGVPLLYQGQELGMTNTVFAIDDITDIEALNAYRLSDDKESILAIINKKSRNHVRTPMQWTQEKNAGFTEGAPWTKINPNYREINAGSEQNDPSSVFTHYRKLLSIRKGIEGMAEFLDLPFPLIGYRRGEHFVMGNLSEEEIRHDLAIADYDVVLNTEKELGEILLPWQTVLLRRR
jgi:oligo-1,6-glucosidase